MTIFLSHRRMLGRLAGALLFMATQGVAAEEMLPAATGDSYDVAAADCYAVGEQVAAQYGGTLAKASASNRGGQTVCHIVVLVPGKDGQRPRRIQVDVPAG
jgi:hypothetical protein